MHDIDFLLCATYLKRDTGYETETVGMGSVKNGIAIHLTAHKKDDYRIIVDDFSVMDDDMEKWNNYKPTKSQMSVLHQIFMRELDKLSKDIDSIELRGLYDKYSFLSDDHID